MNSKLQKLLLILLLGILSLSNSKAQWQVPEWIQNVNSDNPTVYAFDLGGGYQNVLDLSARNDIPTFKRALGMMVTYYDGVNFITARYDGPDTTLTNWVNPANWASFPPSYWGKLNGTIFPASLNDSIRMAGTGDFMMGVASSKTSGAFRQYSISGTEAPTIITPGIITLQDYVTGDDKLILQKDQIIIQDYVSSVFQNQILIDEFGIRLGNPTTNFSLPVSFNMHRSSDHSNSVSINGETGNLTTIGGLTIQLGSFITEFSIDGTLTGNSDNALPTEKAVKTYADNLSYSLADVLLVGNKTLGTDISITAGDEIGFGSNQSIFSSGNYLELTNDLPGGYAIRMNTLNGFYQFDENELKAFNTSTSQTFKFDLINDQIQNVNAAGNVGNLTFPQTGNYTWSLPASQSGTLALTSQLTAYLPLAGGTMSGDILMDNNDILGVKSTTSTILITDTIINGNDTLFTNRFSFADAQNNLIIGRNAGLGVSTEFGNVLLGYKANETTDVRYVTATGYNCLKLATSDYSTFYGALAAQAVTTPTFSSGFGFAVADSATEIDYFTGMGYAAGRRPSVLDRTVLMGYSAGGNKDSIKYTVSIGHEAGMADGTAQGYSLYDVYIGEYAGRLGKNTQKNVVIGAVAQRNDYLDNENNVIIGFNAFRNTGGINNTAIGNQAGWHSDIRNFSQDSCILIGNGAGSAFADTADNKFIIAIDSTDAYKIFDGEINGTSNTLLINGVVTISDNSTDYLKFVGDDTYLGRNAGGTSHPSNYGNTFIGVGSGEDLNGGYFNTGVGELSLRNVTNGDSNVGFGRLSLSGLVSGDDNTALGYNAASQVNTGVGNVCIGYGVASASGDISNKLYIDNSNTTTPLIYGEFDNDIVKINGKFEVTDTTTIQGYEIRFNESEGVYEFEMGVDGVVWQGALEDLVQIYNDTPDTLFNFKPFRFTGSIGDTMATADYVWASSPMAKTVRGLITADIPPNDWGYGAVRGKVRGGNTSTLLFTGPIYMSDDTALTNTPPAYPADLVVIGGLINQDNDSGIVYIDVDLGFQRIIQGKSYSFTSQGIGAGTYYKGGYYDYSSTDANLTQASITQTYGTANIAYSAHPFIVCAGVGTTDAGVVGLRITGTSIDDNGVRTTSDADTILTDITAVATNEYYEGKKFIGTVTYELIIISGTPTTYSFDFNYGYAKYEDIGNRDFYIFGIEAVGLAAASDNAFDIRLLHHKNTGWTYAATGFVAGNGSIASWSTDLGTEDELANGTDFAWKRTNLNTFIDGNGSEGIILEITTGQNNSVQTMDVHISGAIE